MDWLSICQTLVRPSSVLVSVGVSFLFPSAVLIALGLLAARRTRREGAAQESVLLRAVLVGVLLLPGAGVVRWLTGVETLTMPLPSPLQASIRAEPLAPPVIIETHPLIPPSPVPINLPDGIGDVEPAGPDCPGITPIPTMPIVPLVVPVAAAPGLNAWGFTYVGILVAWLAIILLLIGRLGAAHLRLVLVRRTARPAADTTLAMCGDIAREFGLVAPKVLTSKRINSPCLIGFLRPVILLPSSLEPNPALRHVLIHELAHLARRDCFWNLLGYLATATLFFQPLVLVLRREMERAGEDACDDQVMQSGLDRRRYATCLLEIAERFSRAGPEALLGTGMSVRPSALGRRVRRILDATRVVSASGVRRAFASAALLVCCTIAGSALFAVRIGREDRSKAAGSSGGHPELTTEPTASPAGEGDDTVALTSHSDTSPATAPATADDLSNMSPDGRLNALKDAIGRGRLARVTAILDRYPELLNTQDRGGASLIYLAAMENNRQIAELLVARGADINAQSGGLTLLRAAMLDGRADAAKLLADLGAELDLLGAAAVGRLDLVRKFVDADPQAAKAAVVGEMTPLHAAAMGGQMEVVRFLLGKGADVNAVSRRGKTPLHFGVYPVARPDVARFLLDHGADLNTSDKVGRTPLHDAAMSGSPEMIRLLLARGADVNAEDTRGCTALHLAASAGHLSVMEALLAGGARINRPDENGNFPLHAASQGWGLAACAVDLLLARGAKIDQQNRRGETALHLAAARRTDAQVVYSLLTAGADASIKDDRGRTPLDVASEMSARYIRAYKPGHDRTDEFFVFGVAQDFLFAVIFGRQQVILDLAIESPPRFTRDEWLKRAAEVHERYPGIAGKSRLADIPETVVAGDRAAVRWDEKGSGHYLFLVLHRTQAGWRVADMGDSPASVPVQTHLESAATKAAETRPAAMPPATQPAEGDTKPHQVRQRFVPGKAKEQNGNGAMWTGLVPSPTPGMLWLRAFAGIGDEFPVKKNERTLFEVVVDEGNDDRLGVEVRSKEGSQRIELPRDKSVWVEVAARKYVLSYPSVWVSSDRELTTSRAMLMVHCQTDSAPATSPATEQSSGQREQGGRADVNEAGRAPSSRPTTERPIYVAGEVQRPGVYKAQVPLTLRQVIASAGGMKPQPLFARKPTCEICRHAPDGKELTRIVDLNAIIAGKALDLKIEPDDLLVVACDGRQASDWREEPAQPSNAARASRPASATNGVYYLHGVLERPGTFPISEQRMTLRRAIAAAEGIQADVRGKRLICRIEWRGPDGKPGVITIDDLGAVLAGKRPDMEIYPNDLIEIEPEGAKPHVGKVRSATSMPGN